MKWFNRIVGGLIVLVLVALLSIWAFSPFASRSAINGFLAEHSLELTPESTIRLNPFKSRLSISALAILDEGKTPLKLDQLDVRYRLLPLIQKRVEVPEVVLTGFTLTAIVSEDKTVIAGIPLVSGNTTGNAELPQDTLPKDTQPEEAPSAAEPSPFIALADHIEFRDITLDLHLAEQDLQLHLDKLGFKSLVFDQAATHQLASGAFELAGLSFSDKHNMATLEHLSIQLEKFTATSAQDAISEITAALSVNIEALLFTDKETGDVIASLGELGLPDISLQQGKDGVQATIPTIAVQELLVSHMKTENHAALLDLDSLDIQQIVYADDHVSIDTIRLGAIEHFALLTAEGLGNLLLPKQTSNAAPEENTPDTAEETATADEPEITTEPSSEQTVSFSIASISSAKESRFHIEDRTRTPAFDKVIKLESLSIENIDSRDPTNETQFSAVLKDEKYMAFTLNGKAQVFNEKVNAEFESELREFSLPEVNSYLEESLNFAFKAGQLDTTAKGNIVDSEIDSSIKLTIRGSDFSASQAKEDEVNLIGQAAVPLNVALGMIKDKQGNIDLTIPIRGNVNDPNFGFEYILGLVIKKAVMRQAKNYLMTTFVPYSQVVSVAMTAGSFALKVRFEDLEYNGGQTEILEAQSVFVDQLSTMMKDKPKMQVKVCPISTPADKPNAETEEKNSSFDPAALANQRAEAFKSAVVANGVDSSRLLICAPKVEQSTKKKPRISFSI